MELRINSDSPRKQRGSDEGRQEAKLKFTCKL